MKAAAFHHAQSSDETGEYDTTRADLMANGKLLCNLLNGEGDWCEEDFRAIADLINALPDFLELARKAEAYQTQLREVEDIAGRALGYPRYADDPKNFPDATDADGVCIGEHVAETIVEELAAGLRKAERRAIW